MKSLTFSPKNRLRVRLVEELLLSINVAAFFPVVTKVSAYLSVEVISLDGGKVFYLTLCLH